MSIHLRIRGIASVSNDGFLVHKHAGAVSNPSPLGMFTSSYIKPIVYPPGYYTFQEYWRTTNHLRGILWKSR
jgi:hypothetical protein